MHPRLLAPLVVLAAFLFASSAGAQPAPLDLDGKTIRVLVPNAAGGLVDTEARLVQAHIGRFLPGRPNIIVQNIQGAGGERMLEFLNQNDSPDNMTIALISSSVLLRSRAGQLSVDFDPRTVNWIGNLPASLQAFVVATSTGITSPDMLVGRPLNVAAVSAGGTSHIAYLLLNRALGFDLMPIVGYEAIGTMTLALGRNEIGGLISPYSSYAQFIQPLIDSGTARLLFYLSLDDYPGLGVPNALNLPMDDAAAQILRAGLTGTSFGRPFFAPPGSDPAFVALMRTAFEAMVHDPDFLAAAAALDIAVRYRSAAEIEAGIANLYATPDEIIAAVGAVVFAE